MKLVRAAAAIALALGLGWAVVHHGSPALLKHDFWANPAYVLLGLGLHSYAEAWSAHGADRRRTPDFTFGAGTLLARISGDRCAAKTAWSRLDAVIPVLLCWVVVLAGVAHLVVKREEGGLPAAIFTVLLVGGAFFVKRSKR